MEIPAKMTNSQRIAGLIGPTLIALTISEAVNSHIWAAVTPPNTYLVGTLWFVAGLSIVRAHNHWTRGWPVLITLVGWFAILGGLFRMFVPEMTQQSTQDTSALVVLGLQMILFAIGILLTFKAYSREKS
jgi:uncharacterized membrane protein YhaH (DUF805 family)